MSKDITTGERKVGTDIVNCTIVDNTATTEAGGLRNCDGTTTITNCIIWGNDPCQLVDSSTPTYSCFPDASGNNNIDGDNAAAREDMALASLFGRLALANAKLGAVHGFAGPLGGMISAPHGAICGALVPHVMEANVRALQSRKPGSAALGRYDEIARILTGRAAGRAADGVKWVKELCVVLKVPTLAELGLKEQDFAAAAQKSQKSNSMKGNPVELTEAELVKVLKYARGHF